MGYTARKIRGINLSFFLAAIIFACWAAVCAYTGWPRGFRAGSTAGFCLFAAAALFFMAFPMIWARYPAKHPVNHELMRWGKRSEVSERLDLEMEEKVESIGPFRFTASFLVYDSGHEFQLVPYAQIISAEASDATGDDAPSVTVCTRNNKRYQWYRTWLHDTFDPEQIREKVRRAANLDSSARPASAAEAPSAED